MNNLNNYENHMADNSLIFNEKFNKLRTEAEQGNPNAQWQLGRCYEEGTGTQQDYVKAIQWYKKATKQRHYPAIADLINCYVIGLGGKKNHKKSGKWFRKVANRGDLNILFGLL